MLYFKSGLIIDYINKLATGRSGKVYSGSVACHKIMLVGCLAVSMYAYNVSA